MKSRPRVVPIGLAGAAISPYLHPSSNNMTCNRCPCCIMEYEMEYGFKVNYNSMVSSPFPVRCRVCLEGLMLNPIPAVVKYVRIISSIPQ